MRLNGTEIFTVSDGASPPCQKRLADMMQFEVLCAAKREPKKFMMPTGWNGRQHE